jgi:trk system potassium uptake protein TrkH
LSAPRLFVGSFVLLVAIGTLGFRLLPGLYTGEPLGWLDSLFTATSAVCVTGLAVVDTATYFTVRGQAWILLLIQLGGLGIVAFGTLVILALGRRLSLAQEALAGAGDVAPHVDLRQLARDVVRFTLLFEAAGAVSLYLLWWPRLGVGGAAWPAVFHSVSAFCNAGFSTFSDSLIGFQREPATLAVVMALVVLGGLGFLTLEELQLVRRKAGLRLSLHSKLALATTASLLVVGWAAFAWFEWSVTLGQLPVADRLVNALFASVTARTAGFHSVDYGLASESANFLTILLMSVGGSPGSTAGGVKTTTLAVVLLLAWARFRGRELASAWGRTIPPETVDRAVGLVVFSFSVVTLAIFLYTATEIGTRPDDGGRGPFLQHMFEAASAFNTVGLSMGVTPRLSPAGRLVTVFLMFVGRVGILTFAAAIALRDRRPGSQFRYAWGEVVIG